MIATPCAEPRNARFEREIPSAPSIIGRCYATPTSQATVKSDRQAFLPATVNSSEARAGKGSARAWRVCTHSVTHAPRIGAGRSMMTDQDLENLVPT